MGISESVALSGNERIECGNIMSEKSQLILMAKYNQLMNQRLLTAASELSNDSLVEDKGAFFKSVIGSLNHILIGDILWLTRFAYHPTAYSSLKPLFERKKPSRLDEILYADLSSFGEERAKIDHIIIQWCNEIIEDDLDKPLRHKNFKGVEFNKRLGDLILHLFLHQIHHRGQITTLLSQENIDFGETDLPEIVANVG